MHKSIDRCCLLEFVETKNVLVCVQRLKMCWSVFKIVAEASKRRQNTVLTTTAVTARASFTANYGKITRCN